MQHKMMETKKPARVKEHKKTVISFKDA
jgi:hypothetical protein